MSYAGNVVVSFLIDQTFPIDNWIVAVEILGENIYLYIYFFDVPF